MDSMIAAAARLLATGDLIGALKRIALRDDPAALAMRGIAMAQLGDLERARMLLRSAARGFGTREAVARARCFVALAEIALVSRELGWSPKALAAAKATLEAHGDVLNAAYAGLIDVRRLLLIGRLDEAGRMLATFDPAPLPPASRAAYELAAAGIALRRLQTGPARAALARAGQAARAAGISALLAEVESASAMLATPAARLVRRGEQRLLLLDEVEALLASDAIVVDACRYGVRAGATIAVLKTRPVLFTLARMLGEAWPGEVSRQTLVARAFRAKQADESHRVRLRMEIGRLRDAVRELIDVTATRDGFQFVPRDGREVVVLAPPVEEHGELLAFLSDGESWSTSALAIALGSSPRTVQRALGVLAEQGKARAFGRGPARRWTIHAVPGFPSTLLLPVVLAGG